MKFEEIKELAQWALDRGAAHVRVGGFEMVLPPPGQLDESAYPAMTPKGWEPEEADPYDPDEHHDPDAEDATRRAKTIALLTHSGG